MDKVSIIIVSYNTRQVLKDCLNSIFKTKQEVDFEVIVIDNNSKDDSTEMIKQDFPKIKLIENNQNLGFAKANNQGIKEASGNYIFLLNSDTLVSDNSLDKLVSFAQSKNNLGIFAPKLINQDGTDQTSVRKFPSICGAIKEYFFKQKGSFNAYVPNENEFSEVESVVGAALLIPKEIFSQVGLLNERYFMYFEDLDFCRRVRDAGFKIYYLSSVRIVHLVGESGKNASQKTYQMLQKSSQIYHGFLKNLLLQFILKIGQKV